MASEPTLDTLLNYQPQPQLAAGDRDVVPDNNVAVQGVLQAGRDAAQYSWQKYALNQKNLSENIDKYKSDYDKARPIDISGLAKRQAKVLSLIARDPTVLTSPNKNPQLWEELNKEHSALQADIAKSKTLYAYTQEQRKYQATDPNLRTKENDEILRQAEATPLDKADVFQLKPPTVLDFSALTKAGLERATVSKPVDEPIFEVTVGKDGKPKPVMEDGKPKVEPQTGQIVYQQHYTGKRRVGLEKSYDSGAYEKYGDAIYESNQPINKYGTTVQESVSSLFNLLPDNQKEDIIKSAKQNGQDVLKYFYKTAYKKYFDPTKDISGVKSEDDKKYLEDLRFDREQANILLRGSLDKDAIKLRWGLENADKQKQTDAVLRITGSALGNTENRKIAVENQQGGGYTSYTYLKPNDETLNIFGEAAKTQTKTQSLSGVDTVTETSTTAANKPDALARSDNGSVVALYYNKKDGKIQYENGDKTKPIYERQDVFSPTEVLGLVAKNFKIKPESVSDAEKILENQYGGNIINYSEGKKVGKYIAPQKSAGDGSKKQTGSISISSSKKYRGLDKDGNPIIE